MPTPEGVVEKYFLKRCKALGFMCLKFTSPGTRGVPDRVIIGHGWTVFVELKAPSEGLRRLQQEVIKDMRSHGAIVHVANSKELVDELLAELIRPPAQITQ